MPTASIRQALDNLTGVLRAQPEKARKQNPPARVRLAEGLRCTIEGPHGESAQTDMPPAMGGAAGAPSPGWLMRAAVGSCAATAIAMRAAVQGIELTALEVEVESASDARGLIGIGDVSAALDSIVVKVRIGGRNRSAEELRALVQWGDAHSPVGCTLRRGGEYRLQVDVVES